jgi:MFS family permease
LIAGMVLTAVTAAWFPWGGNLWGYFVVRLLNGFGGALSLIPLETLVNHNSPPEQRSRDFGFYAFSVASGIALGTALGMAMYAAMPYWAFVLGGAAALLAGVVVFCWLDWKTILEEQRAERAPLQFANNFLSFGSAWIQGFLEGGMVSMMPLYLLWLGMSEAGAGGLLGGIMIGVIVAQVPLAWLADRIGRTAVMLGCYAVTGAVLLALHQGLPRPAMAACLFLAGACSGAFYPLGLAVLGERLPALAIPRASACFLAINCAGSLVGPVATGVTMDLLGKPAIFLAGLGALLFVLILWAVIRAHAFVNRAGAESTAETAVAERDAA